MGERTIVFTIARRSPNARFTEATIAGALYAFREQMEEAVGGEVSASEAISAFRREYINLYKRATSLPGGLNNIKSMAGFLSDANQS